MSNLIITPAVFKQAMMLVLADANVALVDNWYDTSSSTKVWEKSSGIYKQLGDKLDLPFTTKLSTKGQKYQIDAVFYKKSSTYVLVALEHENMASTSYQEIDKFCMLDMPLKVLVTYPKQKNPADGYYSQPTEEELLEDYTEQINKYGFNQKSQQMVIFGFKDGEKITWKYYLFDGKKFNAM